MISDIRPAFRQHLIDDTAISAIVATRVYPILLPQGQTDPSIVYTRISAVGGTTMQGPDSLVESRMQVDCWASDVTTAASLANLVKERLNGFQGQVGYGGNSPANRVRIQGIFFDSEREFYDDGNKMYRISRDYFVNYEEF